MTIYDLFMQCCDLLDGIGLYIDRDRISLEVSSKMTVMFGKCITDAYGHHRIKIAARVMDDNVPVKTKENVMIHELLHSRHPEDHHGGMWAYEARVVTRKLGYKITMYGNSSEMGVKTKRQPRKYVCACSKCGKQWTYAKMCGPVQRPSDYQHTGCGGSLKRIA